MKRCGCGFYHVYGPIPGHKTQKQPWVSPKIVAERNVQFDSEELRFLLDCVLRSLPFIDKIGQQN